MFRDDGPQIKPELDKAVAQLGEANQLFNDLRDKAIAVAVEYERVERLLSSGAVAAMLREWVGEFR